MISCILEKALQGSFRTDGALNVNIVNKKTNFFLNMDTYLHSLQIAADDSKSLLFLA